MRSSIKGMKQTIVTTLFVAIVFSGCATTKPIQTRRLKMEPFKLVASKDKIDVFDALSLFEKAGKAFEQKAFKEAIASYIQLLKHFPQSDYISAALYNLGLAHESRQDFHSAAHYYRRLVKRFASTKDALDASFRLGACYAELEEWQSSINVYESLLTHKDLSSGDRIEAYARTGFAYYRLEKLDQTQKVLEAALRFAQSIKGVERLDSDFFLGMAYYYYGAIPHLQFRQKEVPSKDMGPALDEKARLLMVAQRRYISAIRVKNPYWATAAGFQVGSLYREFYDVLMTTLPDFRNVAKKNSKKAKISEKEAQKQLVQVYLEEVHKKVKPLLAKAVRVFEKNVVVGQRIGIQTRWLDKSKDQISELKKLIDASPSDVIKLLPKKSSNPEDRPARSRPSSLPAPQKVRGVT